MENNNLIIAQFMELEIYTVTNDGTVFLKREFEGQLSAPIAKYHSSWDWLMPVVEKIDSMRDEERFKVTALFLGTSIKDVHAAVVDYIKWYNDHQKK